MRLGQAQMRTDHMHITDTARNAQGAMQQPALFRPGDRHVVIGEADDRKLRQHGVSVMALRIDRIAAVCELRPYRVRQELVVRRLGPVAVLARMPVVRALDLLEEHHVGTDRAHGIAQLGQDELAIEGGESLVGVHRHDFEGRWRDGHGGPDNKRTGKNWF